MLWKTVCDSVKQTWFATENMQNYQYGPLKAHV